MTPTNGTSMYSERMPLRPYKPVTAGARKKRNEHAEVHPPVSEYFGELTFGLGQMREKLGRTAYNELVKSLEQGKKLSAETADEVAHVIREWSVMKGATHFCHWFQPMTGLTAEKHDAFISIQHSNHSELKVIERLSGGQLIQGEPDASSFPSGGMRSTFEARGYTAWDPSSPLFIVEGELGKTVCIPTVFLSYHGEALDNKTPLLRSVESLSSAACEFLKCLGDVDVRSVQATLGAEQEYFLLDKQFVAQRPDLLMCGRTVLGASSARGQQLEDHYFGSIPGRVKTFMEDLEIELYRLGIPVKTRHNEVAPAQFELAPIFENVNIAADHNTLLMETMKRIANRHDLHVLFHEKPFARINGTGKHCNWSIANDKGENLLEPGRTPHQNLRFLAVMAVVLKAVKDNAGALRASIASPGNDHRLGGNEAPPAIISVFLGSMLTEIFNQIDKGQANKATEAQIINLGVSHLPQISKDYTDRNRTSPFAFTGNKFEFRAVGGSANVAVPVAFLNAAVADAFKKVTPRLKALLGSKPSRDEAVVELVKELYREAKGVCFEGNGYSAEWRKEAKKRGLPILDSSVEALEVLTKKEVTQFLIDTKTLSATEIASRHHIAVERYNKTVEIELVTLVELVQTYVVPSVEAQLAKSGLANDHLVGPKNKKAHGARIEALSDCLGDMLTHSETLSKALAKWATESDEEKKMKVLAKELQPMGAKLRDAADTVEGLVANDLWSLPKYREMLFADSLG